MKRHLGWQRKLAKMPAAPLSWIFTVTGSLATVFSEKILFGRDPQTGQPVRTSCHLHTALNSLCHSKRLRFLGVLRKNMDTDDFLVTVKELSGVSKLLFWTSFCYAPKLQCASPPAKGGALCAAGQRHAHSRQFVYLGVTAGIVSAERLEQDIFAVVPISVGP